MEHPGGGHRMRFDFRRSAEIGTLTQRFNRRVLTSLFRKCEQSRAREYGGSSVDGGVIVPWKA
jgi:hypothetical protein